MASGVKLTVKSGRGGDTKTKCLVSIKNLVDTSKFEKLFKIVTSFGKFISFQ